MLNPKKKNSNTIVTKESEKKVSEENKKPEMSSDNPDFWSEDQQKALENALKKYPNTLAANERWAKISSSVTGKTKKECVDRFKYIAQLIKNKTSA